MLPFFTQRVATMHLGLTPAIGASPNFPIAQKSLAGSSNKERTPDPHKSGAEAR